MSILPVARSVYLCESYARQANGNVDLHGLFSAIHPKTGFPYLTGRFCIFAQFANGLGKVPFFVDIRFLATGELVWTSGTHHLIFPDRNTIVQMAVTATGCRFERPGLYVVDLFCDNTWMSDTLLTLRQ
jgi:hypothetical protein